MASKICVPCDFGIANMYDPFHGNVNIEFNDGSKIRVNSLILSWNSDTLCYFFNELRLTNVEIKDFTKEAVILFLESLYTGDLKLEKSLFRELYKLSLVFKTKWLTDRCTEFLYQLCQTISNDFEELCFVFNEASYANNSLKNGKLVEIFVDRFSKIENIATIFVERYLNETFTSIASETLNHLLLICAKDFVPVLKSLKQHLIEGDIEDTTRSLLSNFKIVECLADNLDIYEDVCELLPNKSGNMIGDDFKMLTNLNLSVIRATRGIIKTFSKQVVPVQDIPNLFHNGEMFYILSNEEVIKRLTSIPNISVFMMVELLVFWVNENYNLLQSMTQILTSKLLCGVPRIFVQRFHESHDLVNLPQSFFSEDDTAVIVSEETTEQQFVTTANYYKFYFQHPATLQCENDTECGFVLKVTPCSKKETDKFNIQLVTEESEYPADIHCHSEVISAAHMHLVLEENYEFESWCDKLEKNWHNVCISWLEKPEYREERGGVEWSDALCDNSRARLVVYYDIRDKK